jgi:hypothetical protein
MGYITQNGGDIMIPYQIKPLRLKFYDEIEPNRIVLYREDLREIRPD